MGKNSEVVVMFLVGVYVLVGVYHFLIFLIRRTERYNAFCGILSLFMGLYFFSRTHSIYSLIPNTLVVVKLEFFFVFLTIPALGIFTELLCLGSVRRVTKWYTGFFGFLALSQLFFPHPYGSDALVVWQVAGIAALLWILAHNILTPFVREVQRTGRVRSALWNSYPGNLLIGAGIFIFCAITDIGNALFLHYPVSFSRYGLCAFALAMALMLARLYGKMSRELAAKSALLENAENPQAALERVFREHHLTEREKEVARLMVEGLDNKAIADRLFVSLSTVGFHGTNIYRKFNINSRNRERAAFLAKVLR